MNALVKADQTALALQGALDPFATAGEDMAGTNGTYLKFNGNSGEFTYGQEAEELALGTKLAVNMNNFRRGWICWVDSEVVDEVLVRVVEGKPPAENQLADHGPYVKNDDRNDGWSEQAAVDFRDIETGKEFIFKHSSASALRALGTLLKDYGKDYKNHPGEVPVVVLDTSSFTPKNKKWGKKYSPIFRIVEWVSEEELMSRFGDNAADYEGGEGAEGEDDPANYEGGEAAPETTEEPPFEDPKPAAAPKQTAAPAKTAAPAATPGTVRKRAF